MDVPDRLTVQSYRGVTNSTEPSLDRVRVDDYSTTPDACLSTAQTGTVSGSNVAIMLCCMMRRPGKIHTVSRLRKTVSRLHKFDKMIKVTNE